MNSSDTENIEKELESLRIQLQDLSTRNILLQHQNDQISKLKNEIQALHASAREACFESSLIRRQLSELHLDYSNTIKALIACQEKLELYITLASHPDMTLSRSREMLTRFYSASSRLVSIALKA